MRTHKKILRRKCDGRAVDCPGLQREIAEVLNRHAQENGSDTPDFLLAKFLLDCLAVYGQTVKARDRWYAFKPWPNDRRLTPRSKS